MSILVCKVSEHGVIVNDDNKILVLQNINSQGQITDKWVFSGGRLEENDKPGAALLREIQEETALTNIKVVWPVYNSRWGSDKPQRYSVIYLCRALGRCDVKLQLEEHPSFKWMSWDEAFKAPFIYPEFLTALRRAQLLSGVKELQNYDFLNSAT